MTAVARTGAALALAGLGLGGGPGVGARAWQTPPFETVAFVGASVLPMTEGSGVLPDQTVIVTGDRISRVGPRSQVVVPPGARRIEAAGQYLMPGLADMHVHLEYFERPDVLDLFLASGVTTVRNMDGRPYILGWRRDVARGALSGPTIVTAGPILDGDPPVLPDNTVVKTDADAVAAVEAQAGAGYDFVKVYSNLAPEPYRAVLRAAASRGLKVAGHVPRRIDAAEAVAAQASVEHLTDYGDWIEAADSPFRDGWHWSKLYLAMPADPARMTATAARIAASGVWTVPTLVQTERSVARPEVMRGWMVAPEFAVVPEDGRSFWRGRLERVAARMDEDDWKIVERGRENRRRFVAALHAAGARLLVGTDTPNPFVVPGRSIHEELGHLVAAGVPPAAVLAAATREAARFTGGEKEWGTVVEGRRADLLLLKGSPLQGLEHLERPLGVMARGRWFPAEELERRASAAVLR